jgi:putative DNA methylase
MAVARDNVNLDTVKELAYLLYSIAGKNGWSDIAQLFNGLGTSWSELDATSRTAGIPGPTHMQGQLGSAAG